MKSPQQSPLINPYQHLSEEEILVMNKAFKKVTYKKNDILLRNGEIANYAYYLEKGLARAFYYKEDKEITNWFAYDGLHLVSAYSFISRKPSYETIHFLEDSTLHAIHYDKLHQLYAVYPSLQNFGRLLAEYYYVWLEERLISLQFQSAKERYEHLLATEPIILQRSPLNYVASYLGITQETLSRIRADF